jgi:hypothetical protein
MNDIIQHLSKDQPAIYRIELDGNIDQSILTWFDDMILSTESSEEGKTTSTLVGLVADQAALHGLLNRIYTLGFLVISVTRIERS